MRLSTWLAALALPALLTGCGSSSSSSALSSSSTAPVTTGTTTTSTAQLAITSGNAQSVGTSVMKSLLPFASLSSSDPTTLSGINAALPNDLIHAVAIAIGVLGQGGSQTLTGPQGGTATVTVSSGTSTLTFNNYQANNTTLNGSAAGSSSGPGLLQGGLTGNLTFNGLSASSPSTSYQISGPSQLSVTSTNTGTGANLSLTLTTGVTLTSSGSSLSFQSVQAATNSSLTATSISGNSTLSGGLNYSNWQGFTGQVSLSTPVPFSYTLPRPNPSLASLSVNAGQVLLSGAGTLRLTVTSPNTFEVALAPQGSTTFTVLGTTTLGSLLGSL